jgi:hypothetical protein
MHDDCATDWAADDRLSKSQVAAIVWHDDPGEESGGG